MKEGTDQADRTETFTRHRPYLFAVAYRLLGVAEDAEDMLQEAWLRFTTASPDDVRHPRAYLVTVVTRLAIDQLKSARRQREEYVGEWLPEPVSTQEALPEEIAAHVESASFAFLLLLERLTPMQRAVLVLHDVFDFSHEEIGRSLGRTAAASRQLLRRARLGLGDPPPSHGQPPAGSRPLVERFVAATRAGDLDAIMRTLAPDVVLIGDGGGRMTAINRPLVGTVAVGRLLVAAGRATPAARVSVTELNAQPALLVWEQDRLTNAFVLDTTTAGVTAIYVVRNPDKLRRLSEPPRGRRPTGVGPGRRERITS